MASNESNGSSAAGSPDRKPQWFVRRQVYLRTGQDSQYVELSSPLQIWTAIGFGVLALWLLASSFGAIAAYLGPDREGELMAELETRQQHLVSIERERDVALEQAGRLSDLEAALADAEKALTEARADDETSALTAELAVANEQMEELQVRLSESKADYAALEAKFEAQAIGDADAEKQTAEEASSLHAQLEEAFGEIERLQQDRDEAMARITGFEEQEIAQREEIERNDTLLKAAEAEIETLQQDRDDARARITGFEEQEIANTEEIERNDTLLKAAKTEIERLQQSLDSAKSNAEHSAERYQTAIDTLEQELGDVVASRANLQQQVEDLDAQLETAREESPTSLDAETVVDAENHVQSIQAGLKEADLLATIETLRAELTENGGGTDGVAGEEDVRALQQRVQIAESEVERLLFSRLSETGAANDQVDGDDAPAPPIPVEDPVETKRLRSELLAAQADIIKLRADVKAANQRLAEQADTENGQASTPNNSAKLEQQLASARSKVQRLNKALADAKLREVAIDLALINVVPTPSPPAPR